jgi:ABC-type polysaccharide/polyol phosphate export permease
MTKLSELAGSRDLMVNLTLRELRGKYKRSVLGWAWSLLNPIATMLIFTVVFRVFLKIQAPPGDPSGLQVFALFLLCALLPFNYLANSMSGAMGSLVINANLIKKTYFPREILVAANVVSWLVAFLIEILVLCVALMIVGNFVIPYIPVVLLLIVIETAFVLGISLMLSVLNVYFRDVQHLIGILVQLWFYATPIVYPITFVEHGVSNKTLVFIYKLNPMVQVADAFRNCLYDLRLPALGTMLYLVAIAVVTLAFGYFVFSRLEPRLAEEL